MNSLPTARIRSYEDIPAVSVVPGTLETCDLLEAATVDAIAVGVGAPIDGDDELQPRAGTVHASLRYRIDLAELAARADFKAKPGTTHIIDLPITHGGSGAVLPWQGLPLRIVLVGVGRGSDEELRSAGAAVARATRGLGKVLTTVAAISGDRGTEHFVEGYCLGAYPAWNLKKKQGKDPAQELVLLGPNDVKAIERARVHAALTWLSRDLSAVPANIKSPLWMAAQMERIGKLAGINVKRIKARELATMGFGGTLAVGQGSGTPPEFVIATYTPKTVSKKSKHVAIVGKGITFDTGGISIKRPRETMITMKIDMTGAADAFAAVVGAANAELKHTVTALIPLAENHFGADSTRPGDVINVYGGATVEVANTDAEGRVVMADALAYAVKTLKVDQIIDVATLTGAAAMSLGHSHAALYGNDTALIEAVKSAAAETGEHVWHMPLVREYEDALESEIADIRNIPITSIGAGSIVAALFLERFTQGTPWVHLDIAGPAHRSRHLQEANKGPTGFGARVITRYLESL